MSLNQRVVVVASWLVGHAVEIPVIAADLSQMATGNPAQKLAAAHNLLDEIAKIGSDFPVATTSTTTGDHVQVLTTARESSVVNDYALSLNWDGSKIKTLLSDLSAALPIIEAIGALFAK